MASDTIKGAGDIYEKDLYGDIKISGDAYIKVLESINTLLKQQSEGFNKLSATQIKDIDSIKKVNEGIEKNKCSF